MPNTRTITIEVPDFSAPAQDAGAYISARNTERNNIHSRNVEVGSSIEEQIFTYLRELCAPLRGIAPRNDVAKHSTLSCVSICRYNEGGSRFDAGQRVEFALGLHDIYANPLYQTHLYFRINLDSNREGLDFVESRWSHIHDWCRGEWCYRYLSSYGFNHYDDRDNYDCRTHRSWCRNTDSRYVDDTVMLAKMWAQIKPAIVQWVSDEIDACLAASDKALADTRSVERTLADFTL